MIISKMRREGDGMGSPVRKGSAHLGGSNEPLGKTTVVGTGGGDIWEAKISSSKQAQAGVCFLGSVR